MFLKYCILFFIVCFVTGIATITGSVIGHAFNQQMLFAIAIFSGICGVFLSCVLAGKVKKLSPLNFKSTFTGAIIGYVLAVIIAVNFLHSALITMGSISIAGFGAIAGYYQGKKNEKN